MKLTKEDLRFILNKSLYYIMKVYFNFFYKDIYRTKLKKLYN